MLLKNLYRNLSLPLIWAGLFFTLFLFASCHPRPVKLLMGGSGWNQVVIIDKATKEITSSKNKGKKGITGIESTGEKNRTLIIVTSVTRIENYYFT